MWTIDDQCYPEELGPEILAQVQMCLAEYVRTGDEGQIGEGRKRVGPQGRVWFEAAVADAIRARHRRERSQAVRDA